MTVRPHANAKKKTERLKGFKFAFSLVIFKRQHGSEVVNRGCMVETSSVEIWIGLRWLGVCLDNYPVRWSFRTVALILYTEVSQNVSSCFDTVWVTLKRW